MANQGQAANAGARADQAGLATIRHLEHERLSYYNDGAGNCTWGIGTLAHRGPCTAEELRRPVTLAQVNERFAANIAQAEAAVRQAVPNRQLTQAQFNALVSYTYNRGAAGAQPVLRAANQGNDAAVATIMRQNIYAHQHNPNPRGHRLPPVILPGLVNRRAGESAPFRPQRPQGGQ